jgi:hypothetical protein
MGYDLEADVAKRKARKQEIKARKKETGRHLMSAREQTRQLHALKAELLTHKNAKTFVNKLFDIAMDDDHDGQMQAMKMVADRLLPNAGFALDSKKSTAVQINISGLQVSSVEEKEIKPQSDPSHHNQVNGDDVVSIQ